MNVLVKKEKKKASLIKSRTGKTLEGLWKKGAVWWGQGKQHCKLLTWELLA